MIVILPTPGGSCKIHFEAAIFPCCLKKYPVAQAFQPVPAQAEACGYIILQEAPRIGIFSYLLWSMEFLY